MRRAREKLAERADRRVANDTGIRQNVMHGMRAPLALVAGVPSTPSAFHLRGIGWPLPLGGEIGDSWPRLDGFLLFSRGEVQGTACPPRVPCPMGVSVTSFAPAAPWSAAGAPVRPVGTRSGPMHTGLRSLGVCRRLSVVVMAIASALEGGERGKARMDGSAAADALHGSGGRAFPVPLEHLVSAEGENGLWIRYCYDGGKLARDGRLVHLPLVASDVVDGRVNATIVLDQLRREGVDLERVSPLAFDSLLDSWAPLQTGTRLRFRSHQGPSRVDVKLMRTRHVSATHCLATPTDSLFTIGIMGGKVEKNIGTLWRSGFQMGADSVFVIGERFRSESKKRRKDKMLRIKQNRGHVMAGDTTVPLNEFADWNAFASASLASDSSLVAIEMGGTLASDVAMIKIPVLL